MYPQFNFRKMLLEENNRICVKLSRAHSNKSRAHSIRKVSAEDEYALVTFLPEGVVLGF